MDIALPSFSYLLTFLLLLLSILFIRKQLAHHKRKLPPGPWTLPVIGSLHHLATATLPQHALHNLAQIHGPVMLLRAGEIDVVVISSREAAKEVMKTQDANFLNRPASMAANYIFYGCTDILFSSGTYWRQARRICTTELLSTKRVKSFSSIRQEEINSLLKCFSAIPENSPINLSAKISELSNSIIIRAAFGGMCKNRRLFLEILREVIGVFTRFSFSEIFPSLSWLDMKTRRRLAVLRRKLDLVMEGILQEHLKQPKKIRDDDYDLVDVLINAMRSGGLEKPLTMDNIKAITLDVFIGATESSASTIIWAMTELIKNPEIMSKVQAEIQKVQSKVTKLHYNELHYLKLVIKETLRIHPVTPLLPKRLCTENCQVLGYTIPSNAWVIINAGTLGRSHDYWNDPEKFIPERFENSGVDFKGQHFEFVPFGAGRRMCPGVEFATAVMEETLANLLLHFDWKLPDGMKPESLDMTETFGISAAKKEPLYLIPTLCVPLPNI